ncbi:MAG: caspase family protein [Methyloceanibacter sp.]
MAGRQVSARALTAGLVFAAALAGLSPDLGSEPLLAVVTPDTAPTPAPSGQSKDEKAKATARVQRCFAKLGYYKGPVDGKANEATWTAHWYFKNEHGLKSYGDFLAAPVQKKLGELCKEEQSETAAAPEPGQPQPAPEAPAGQTAPEPVPEAPAQAPAAGAPASQPAAPPQKGAEGLPEEKSAEERSDVTAALLSEDLTAGSPAAEPKESLPPIPPGARLNIDCLPADLIELLARVHGDGVRARACHPACLTPPKGLAQPQLDDLQARSGVVWCRSCVQIEGYLALEDVRRIEREGDIELCTTPPRHLPRPGIGSGNVVKSYTRIRELYRGAQPADEDASAIAVIIGNGDYTKLPRSETAIGDAGAMYSFLTERLGYRQDNIMDLRNARKADLERLFGPEPGSQGDLARLARSQPDAKVLVYFSGHGATNANHSEVYLLPVDAEPYREERSGYPLSTLYANVAGLKAKSVLVLLEAEYGRDQSPYVLPPNLPETTRSALPPSPLPAVTILAASDRGQRTLIDTSYDIGLFTRYLIEGLSGSADLYPVGNGDGVVDSTESYVYTAAMVRLAARKTFGLLQNPVYSSATPTALSAAGRRD